MEEDSRFNVPSNIYYILENSTIRTTTSLLEWGAWMQNGKRQIFDHQIDDEIRISTVFLGLNHSFTSNREPILFETMIFGGVFDQIYQERCRYLSECSDIHFTAVDIALRSCDFKGMSWRNIKKIAKRPTNWMNDYLSWNQKELRRYYGKNRRCKRQSYKLITITENKDALQ